MIRASPTRGMDEEGGEERVPLVSFSDLHMHRVSEGCLMMSAKVSSLLLPLSLVILLSVGASGQRCDAVFSDAAASHVYIDYAGLDHDRGRHDFNRFVVSLPPDLDQMFDCQVNSQYFCIFCIFQLGGNCDI